MKTILYRKNSNGALTIASVLIQQGSQKRKHAMSLRTKMLIAQGFFLVTAVIVVFILARSVILSGFQEVEARQGHADIRRARNALAGIQTRLYSMVGDYSEWTDTFDRFHGVQIQEYDSINLSVDVIENLKADVFMLIASSGEIIAGVAVPDYADTAFEEIGRYFAEHPHLLEEVQTAGGLSGLIPTAPHMLIGAIRPVLRTDGSGPSPGAVLFGRYLNDATLRELNERTQTSISFLSMDDPAPSLAPKAVLDELATTKSGLLTILSPTAMAGYFEANDMHGDPLLLVRVLMHRVAYIQGQRTVFFFLGVGLSAGLLLLSLNMLFIKKTVIEPIFSLRHTIAAINRDDDLSRRVALPGEDEVGELASEFNSMLDMLENADKALRKSESLFRGMVENLQGAVYRCRNDEFHTMLYVSDAIETLTGHPASDFVENRVRSYADCIDKEDASTFGAIRQSVEKGEGYSATYRLRRPSGDALWVHEKGRGEYDEAGNLLWLNGFIWDISERIQAEETRLSLERQVQHAQKLESLGVLAGGIAHDFNNLLMVISGAAELVAEDLDANRAAHDNIQLIQQAGSQAADLCKQMLAYAGRGKFVTEAFDLDELIRGMEALLRATVSKKAKLELRLPTTPLVIEGDLSQLQQVVMNLVLNAAEAIGDAEGAIVVSGGIAQLEAKDLDANLAANFPDGRCVLIEVSDTGCGMNEETIGRVFEPFFTTKFAGRGLGMSAVQGIVRSHHGFIRVVSELGRGSVFSICLPAAPAEALAKPTPPAVDFAKRQGKGVVLFVDDEELLREVGKKTLGRLGFEVWTAADGREALKIFRERGEAIHLVMLDMTMPNMDGEETYHALRRLDPKVRVIIASGYSEQEIEARFAGHELLGILQKPYSLTTLRKYLQPFLNESPKET